MAARTLAQLGSCPVDIIGTEGNSQPASDPQPIPTLEQVLDLAREQHARVNIEIKNQPGDPDFDAGSTFANRVMDGVVASKIPGGSTIIQSFWPPNLEVAQSRFPAAETSYLQLGGLNATGIAVAKSAGYEWVSSGGATESPDRGGPHRGAAGWCRTRSTARPTSRPPRPRGVDELISNDPTLARRALAEVDAPAPAVPAAPSDADCARVRAKRTLPAVEAYDPGPQAPRVFAIQFKQEVRHIETYASFRTKMECLVREFVLPRLARGRPNVVALNEDVGLLTIATGSRGRAAREALGQRRRLRWRHADRGHRPRTHRSCGVPEPLHLDEAAQRRPSGGATDTFARGWMQVFSDLSKRYGVYMLGVEQPGPLPRVDQRVGDRHLPRPRHPAPRSVYVALDDRVYNEVFMWAPQDRTLRGPALAAQRRGPEPQGPAHRLREGAAVHARTVAPGPMPVENLRPYALPGSGARISFATSLPAFTYGDRRRRSLRRHLQDLHALHGPSGREPRDAGRGQQRPLGHRRGQRRLAAAGVDDLHLARGERPDGGLHLQRDPAPGRQPRRPRPSTARRRSPSAACAASPGCTYVGNKASEPGDERYRAEQGPKSEFIAILPWVTPDASRAELQATAKKLAPGLEGPAGERLRGGRDRRRSSVSGQSFSGGLCDGRPRRREGSGFLQGLRLSLSAAALRTARTPLLPEPCPPATREAFRLPAGSSPSFSLSACC